MIELQGKFGKDCKIFANTIENEAIGTIQNILNNRLRLVFRFVLCLIPIRE